MITLLIVLACIWLLIQIISSAAVIYQGKKIADELFHKDKKD